MKAKKRFAFQWRRKAMLIATLSLIGLTNIFFFQNCSQGYNLKVSGGAELASGVVTPAADSAPVTAHSKTALLNATSTNLPSPFKLLIVVDNSYTMTQSQAKLAEKIDSLLGPLAGQNVDVKIITTTDWGLASYYQDVQSGKISTNVPSELSEYLFITVQGVPQGGRSAQLKNTDTPSKIAATIQQIKSYILGVGTSGSDAEKFLCPLARYLFDKSADSFFKKGDKAAVVLISDEDDSSKLADCATEQMTNHKYPKQSVTVQYKLYKYTSRVFSFTGMVYSKVNKDGILVDRADQLNEAVYATEYDYSGLSLGDQACPKNFLDLVAQEYKNQTDRRVVVDHCTVTSLDKSFAVLENTLNGHAPLIYGNKIEENLRLGSFATDYCVKANQSGFKEIIGGTASPVFYSSDIIGNCSSGNISTGTLDATQALVTSSSSNVFPSSSSMESQVFNQSKYLFGDDFFYTMITNNKTGQCTLATGQTYGQTYDRMAEAYPNNMASYPICAGSYAPALNKLSLFITEKMTAEYSLESLESNFEIQRVEILRGSSALLVDVTHYSVVNGHLKLNDPLSEGDQIKITYIVH